MGRKGSAENGLTPAVRRRLAEVRACERSGESLKAYAARQGISASVLYEAKRHARKLGLLPPHRADRTTTARDTRPVQAPRFVEATLRPTPNETAPAWRLRLPGGEVLESHTPLAVDDALRLIDRLGGRR